MRMVRVPYRNLPLLVTSIDMVKVARRVRRRVVAGDKAEMDRLAAEGKGVILDQGSFGLKFSLPTLYDAYTPQSQLTPRPFRENLQGGTFEIIFRSSK